MCSICYFMIKLQLTSFCLNNYISALGKYIQVLIFSALKLILAIQTNQTCSIVHTLFSGKNNYLIFLSVGMTDKIFAVKLV